MDIKVKHLIAYLQTLNPEADTKLDKDGWDYDVENPTSEEQLIRERGLFNYYPKPKFGDYPNGLLIINN